LPTTRSAATLTTSKAGTRFIHGGAQNGRSEPPNHENEHTINSVNLIQLGVTLQTKTFPLVLPVSFQTERTDQGGSAFPTQ